jgi:hypothetical protein
MFAFKQYLKEADSGAEMAIAEIMRSLQPKDIVIALENSGMKIDQVGLKVVKEPIKSCTYKKTIQGKEHVSYQYLLVYHEDHETEMRDQMGKEYKPEENFIYVWYDNGKLHADY